MATVSRKASLLTLIAEVFLWKPSRVKRTTESLDLKLKKSQLHSKPPQRINWAVLCWRAHNYVVLQGWVCVCFAWGCMWLGAFKEKWMWLCVLWRYKWEVKLIIQLMWFRSQIPCIFCALMSWCFQAILSDYFMCCFCSCDGQSTCDHYTPEPHTQFLFLTAQRS